MDELRQYIQTRRKSGISDEAIKNELLAVGWDLMTINSQLVVDSNFSSDPALMTDNVMKAEPVVIQNQMVSSDSSVGVAGTLVVDENRNASTNNYLKSGSSKKVWGLLVFLLLFLITGFFVTAYGIVYAGWRPGLLSEKLRNSILLSASKIPGLPKTGEQILLLAVNNAQEMEKYDLDMSMSVSLGGKSSEIAKMDLLLKGPIDISEVANVQADMEVKVGVNWLGTLYSGGMLIKKPAEKKIYFQLQPLSDSIWSLGSTYLSGYVSGSMNNQSAEELIGKYRQALEEIFENWILYDLADLDTESRKLLDERDFQQEVSDKSLEVIQRFMKDQSFTSEFVLIGKERINNIDAYHVVWQPSVVTLQRLVTEYYEVINNRKLALDEMEQWNKSLDMVESMKTEFWFDAEGLMLKNNVIMVMDFGSFSQPSNSGLNPMMGFDLSEMQKLSVSYSISMNPLETSLVVETPEKALTLQELTQMLQVKMMDLMPESGYMMP